MFPDTKEKLAKYFDHTLLDETADEEAVRLHCKQAVHYSFYAVCVRPQWVGLCADILHTKNVKVVSVAGFPLGTESPHIKARQAEAVIMDGADEVDIVANPDAIVAVDTELLREEFLSVLRICRSLKPPVLLKVIIESASLSSDLIRYVCSVAQQAGVDFLKTSTGFHPAGGARLEDVRLMTQSAPNCRIKAAGGIRSLDQALAFIEAGVSRIGASASVQIMEEFIAVYENA